MARILIVEDETLIAMQLESIVRSLGHEVVGLAASEAHALALVQEYAPDLALVDIRLRLDENTDGSQAGIRLAEELWTCDRVPVVFVTAFPQLVTSHCASNTGAFATIGKPFTPEALVERIEEVLSRQT